MTTSNLFGSIFILVFIVLFTWLESVLLNITCSTRHFSTLLYMHSLSLTLTLSHTHTCTHFTLENSKTMTCLFEFLDKTFSSSGFECPFCNCHPFLVKQAHSSTTTTTTTTTTTIITPFLLFLFCSHNISHRFVYATIIIVLVYGSNACVWVWEEPKH